MNLTKHNSGCHLMQWQLQMKIEEGLMKYRAQCLGCGASTPVTEEECKNWNFQKTINTNFIKVEIPEITE